MSDELEAEMVETPGDEMSAGKAEADDAAAELERTRAALRKANAEAAKYRHTLAKVEEEREAKRKAEMSEMEKLQEALVTTERELMALRGRELRRQVAAQSGLPEALAYRLQGETEEELLADAEQLKATLPKLATGQAPTLPATNPGSNAQEPKLTDKQRLAQLYSGGVDIFNPQWSREHGGGVFGSDDK